MVAPYRLASTSTEITIGWTQPENTEAGCPVQGFAVFADDGLGGTF